MPMTYDFGERVTIVSGIRVETQQISRGVRSDCIGRSGAKLGLLYGRPTVYAYLQNFTSIDSLRHPWRARKPKFTLFQQRRKLNAGAQLRTFPYPTVPKTFLHSNAFMANCRSKARPRRMKKRLGSAAIPAACVYSHCWRKREGKEGNGNGREWAGCETAG